MATRPHDSSPFGVLVIAASLGGVAALQRLLAALPADLPLPVVVVQHRAAEPDLLGEILRLRAFLPVTDVGEVAALSPGIHLVAPHRRYELAGGSARHDGPSGRPADDVMASAAAAYGSRTLAVVLTGRLDDGSRGVRAVKRAGGYVVAQDPADARAPQMPQSAIATGCVDLILPLEVIGQSLVALTMAPGVIDMFPRSPRPWADLSVG